MPDGGLHDAAFAGLSAEAIYERLPADIDEPGARVGVVLAEGDAGDADLAAEWRQAVVEAMTAARLAGDRASEQLRAALGEMLAPRVDWRAHLREFVQQTMHGSTDYSWHRPSRAWAAQDVLLPGMTGTQALPIAVVVDTSGSIRSYELDMFSAEIAAIHADFEPAMLHVLYADAVVHAAEEFSPSDDVELRFVGGGGTDFRPAFEWLAEHAPDVAAVIYLTDGAGRYPEEEAAWPTFWAMTTNAEPPWGRHVVIASE